MKVEVSWRKSQLVLKKTRDLVRQHRIWHIQKNTGCWIICVDLSLLPRVCQSHRHPPIPPSFVVLLVLPTPSTSVLSTFPSCCSHTNTYIALCRQRALALKKLVEILYVLLTQVGKQSVTKTLSSRKCPNRSFKLIFDLLSDHPGNNSWVRMFYNWGFGGVIMNFNCWKSALTWLSVRSWL